MQNKLNLTEHMWTMRAKCGLLSSTGVKHEFVFKTTPFCLADTAESGQLCLDELLANGRLSDTLLAAESALSVQGLS